MAVLDERERLARLEGAYEHLATKADLAHAESRIIKWFVAIALSLVALAFIAARYVP